MSDTPMLKASTMILLTSFTSSLSAAAETSSAAEDSPPLGHRILFAHARKHVGDVAAAVGGLRSVELVDGLLELLLRRDFVEQLRFREHVRRNARAADALGVEAHHRQAFLRLVDRQPQVALDVFALEVLQQVHRLDAV